MYTPVKPEALRAWQDRLALTNEQIARELGVTLVTYSRWRNGHHATPRWLPREMERVARDVLPQRPTSKKQRILKLNERILVHYAKDGTRLSTAARKALPAGSTYWELDGDQLDEWQRAPEGYSDAYTGLTVSPLAAGINISNEDETEQ